MPTLSDLKAANFDHFKYASDVTRIIKATFPAFQTVAFGPIRDDGAPTRYTSEELCPPAFLMTFLAPDFENLRPMHPMLDTDGFGLGEKALGDTPDTFVQMRIRVSGVFLLPMDFKHDDRLKTEVNNIDVYEAAAVACLIIAIKSQFSGLQTADCEIESVETRFESLEAEEGEIYRATEIVWSSEVVMGWEGGSTPYALYKLFADVGKIQILGVTDPEPEPVLESDPNDPLEEWEQDAEGNWMPKDPS